MKALSLIKTRIVPDLDRPDADLIADEILLEMAAKNTVATVTAGATSTSFQSAESRAWTLGGRVD